MARPEPLAGLGNMIAYAGDWEAGLRIVERAMQLNPHTSALKVNMPTYHWPYVYLAAAYGQRGGRQAASGIGWT